MRLISLLACGLCGGHLFAAEVFEASLGREKDLPKGKEADGIRGDFVLRSDRVEATISHNAPLRRANMSTFYGPDGVSPGCLYDLTLRGEANDQLVIYGPCGHGPVSYVRVVDSNSKNEAVVEAVTSAGLKEGISRRNEYRVVDGVQGIYITTTLKNEMQTSQKCSTKSDLTKFESTGTVEGGINWVDAINPAHHCGYAIVTLKIVGVEKLEGDQIELKAGQSVSIHRFMAVGRSPAQAVGEALAASGVKVGQVELTVKDPAGKGISSAEVRVPFGKNFLLAYPNADGKVVLQLAEGSHDLVATDRGRNEVKTTIEVKAGQVTHAEFGLAEAARVHFQIADEEGRSIPCKAHFKVLDEGAAALNLGPKWRAHGCVDQYHSEKGDFVVALPPGRYQATVVRGPEYGHLTREVTLAAGQEVNFKGTLKRLVNTRGWISSDFHNHSTPSGDNVCDIDGRLINLAAEHIEFAPTTEHNRLYDWEPLLNELGLSPYVKTVKGVELTGSRQHFNAFPFEPDPLQQDGGAPVWNDDPRITALTLRRWQGERPDRYIQFNHPDLSNMFVDRDGDGVQDGGFVGVGSMIDASETQNGPGTDILADAPFRVTRAPGALAAKASAVREFIWRQLLNQGLRVTAVGVADAHSVYGNGVGCWRGYVPSPTDDPAKIDWSALSPRVKQGNLVLTTGPFLEVTTQNGKIAGDDDRATGEIQLHIRVQCTDWMDVDRVQILVNSRADEKLNFTRASHPKMFKDGVVKFDEKVRVPLQYDAHLIVVALDEDGDQSVGYGTSDYAKMRPCAYNNPIYVDADGGGFKPNGDTLGYDLPAMGMTADKARALNQKK